MRVALPGARQLVGGRAKPTTLLRGGPRSAGASCFVLSPAKRRFSARASHVAPAADSPKYAQFVNVSLSQRAV